MNKISSRLPNADAFQCDSEAVYSLRAIYIRTLVRGTFRLRLVGNKNRRCLFFGVYFGDGVGACQRNWATNAIELSNTPPATIFHVPFSPLLLLSWKCCGNMNWKYRFQHNRRTYAWRERETWVECEHITERHNRYCSFDKQEVVYWSMWLQSV